MKKLVSMVLVVALLCCAGSGLADGEKYADTAESVKNYAGKMLKQLEGVYQSDPTQCGDEFILLAHAYYEMYQVMREVCTAEGQYTLAANPLSGGKSPTMGVTKEVAANGILLTRATLGEWEKWLNGETDNEKYLSFLMSMVGATTKMLDN